MVKKDGMILEQISLQERRRGRKNSYNIKFRLFLLNQYLDKNTLKAILIWQGLYVLHFRYEPIILLEITKKYIKREVAQQCGRYIITHKTSDSSGRSASSAQNYLKICSRKMEVFTTIDRKVSKYLQGDGIYKFSRIVCFVVALLFFMNQALGLFDRVSSSVFQFLVSKTM